MSNVNESKCAGDQAVQHELHHIRAYWCWFVLLGILLVVCGTLAVVYPVLTSAAVIVVLPIILLVAGIATIIAPSGPAN